MKGWFRLSFFVFYAASSYAVTKERTLLIVGELTHSVSRGFQSRIDKGCASLHSEFPHYQQAKPKTGIDLSFEYSQSVNSSPLPSIGFLKSKRCSFRPTSSFESVLSRAPPGEI